VDEPVDNSASEDASLLQSILSFTRLVDGFIS
jgi:hypothetical protein